MLTLVCLENKKKWRSDSFYGYGELESVRELTDKDLLLLRAAADSYIERSARYRTSLVRIDNLEPDRP